LTTIEAVSPITNEVIKSFQNELQNIMVEITRLRESPPLWFKEMVKENTRAIREMQTGRK